MARLPSASIVCGCGPAVVAGSCLLELPPENATLPELLTWLSGVCPMRPEWMRQHEQAVRIFRRQQLQVLKGGADA